MLSFVGANFTTGGMFGKACKVEIKTSSIEIIGQRVHEMEGTTSDTKILSLTTIHGV